MNRKPPACKCRRSAATSSSVNFGSRKPVMYKNGNGANFVSDGSTLLRSNDTASDDSPERQRNICTVLFGSGSQSPW